MKIEQPKMTKEIVQSLFQDKFPRAEVNFGFVSIPAGARLPMEGTNFHEEHEYSFIIKGGLSTESGGESFGLASKKRCRPFNDRNAWWLR